MEVHDIILKHIFINFKFSIITKKCCCRLFLFEKKWGEGWLKKRRQAFQRRKWPEETACFEELRKQEIASRKPPVNDHCTMNTEVAL